MPIKEAAKRLEISEKALRSRIIRRTIRSRRGNDGRVHVLLHDAPPKHAPEIYRSLFEAEQTEACRMQRSGLETTVVAVLREAVDALKAAHRDTVSALHGQVE